MNKLEAFEQAIDEFLESKRLQRAIVGDLKGLIQQARTHIASKKEEYKKELGKLKRLVSPKVLARLKGNKLDC